MLFNSLRINKNNPFYEYCEDADIISIYFIKPTVGCVNHSEEAVDHKVLISYDDDDKVVSVDVFRASKNLSWWSLTRQAGFGEIKGFPGGW